MDNRERDLREQYDRKDPRVQAIERGYDRWLEGETGCKDLECACATVLIWDELRPLLGEARAAIEGEPHNEEHPPHAPCCIFCGLYQERRAERVLEAAPGKLDRCPKCGGDITSEGGHGLWCRDEKCKWGWEIEPAAVPLPTAREPVNMLWSGTNSQGGSTGRVYNDPLMQKAYDEGRKHGAPVSEGRLREASALPIQWRNIADAKPSSFEFATRDDAFRYCADELERALESA